MKYDVYKKHGTETTEVWAQSARVAAVKAAIKWQDSGDLHKGIVYVRDERGNVSLHGVG